MAGLECLDGWLSLSGYFFLKCDRLGVIFVSFIFEFRGCFFDEIEVWRLDFWRSGVTFLMKWRSGGLLFREKGSMGDMGGRWGPNTNAMTCSWSPFGFILGGFFDEKSIKNRCIF